MTTFSAGVFNRAMPPARLPYLNHERTRHGRMIWVVRVGKGPRTRLRAAYGSPEFLAAYHAAISSPAAVRPRKPGEGTFAWLMGTVSGKSGMGRAIAGDQKTA